MCALAAVYVAMIQRRMTASIASGCRTLGVRSIVAVPIRRGNRVVGLIEVFSSQPYAFTPEDISVLQQLSSTVLSVAGNKAEAHAPASDLPRPSSQEKRAVRVEERVDARVEERPIETRPMAARPVEQHYLQARAIEDQGAGDVLAGTMAAVEPSAAPAISQDSAGRRCHHFSLGCGVVGCALDFRPDP